MQNAFFKYFPLLAFIVVWAFVIGLHQASLYNIKLVSQGTYLVLLSSLFAVVLGYYIATIYDKRNIFEETRTLDLNVDKPLLVKLVFVLTLLSIIGGLLTIYVVGSNLGGYDIYLRRPLLVRQFVVGIQMGENEVSQLYRLGGYLANIGFLSTTLGGILFALKGKIRLFGLFPFVGLLVAQLAIMGRYKFVTGIVFFLVGFVLFSFFLEAKKRRARLLEIFFYSTSSIIVVLTFSYFILKFRSPLAEDIIAILKETGYLYFSGGVTALDKFLTSDFQYTYGQSSFRTFFKWLARLGLWSEESVIPTHNEFVKVSATYRTNTYTYIGSLYRDFGLVGVVFISLIWGVLTKFIIFRVYHKFTLTNVIIASIFVFSFIISFFSFYFQGITSIVFWILIAMILQYFWGEQLFFKNQKL